MRTIVDRVTHKKWALGCYLSALYGWHFDPSRVLSN